MDLEDGGIIPEGWLTPEEGRTELRWSGFAHSAIHLNAHMPETPAR